MSIAGSNILQHYSVLPVAKELEYFIILAISGKHITVW